MPKFDYWNDGHGPDNHPHHGEDYPNEFHDEYPNEFYDDFHYPHPHPMPPFDGHRHQPVDVGKVNTAKMHDRYDMFVPHHMPPWGFKFPKLEKAFVPGSTPQEQVAYLCNRVDAMIDYFNHYDDKVWGAYNAVVHSAFGNEAYYREITREDGYLADGSTPYTVIHIPYLDRAERPIFLELGLAYNNTTNNGVKENAFEASQGRLADKLIPAFNIEDGWEGKAVLKGAPVQSEYTEGKFTLAVTDNGFLKVYPNTVEYEQLHRDRIRNAMGVQGVLINNGAKTPNSYAENGGTLLARVGIGMNYDTKERLIVIVNGTPIPPNDESATGATSDMLADIFARYNCAVAVETANNGSAIAMDKGQMIYMPNSAENGVVPTVPSLNCYWYITKRRHYHNQYVRDVAELIQKVGQNKWRCEIALQSCDFLKGRVNELQHDLDAEVEARIEGDELLGQEIDAEAEIRRLADIQLQDNINAERDARVAGDNALDERITDEVGILNNRIDNEVATINALIEAEEQARIAGDTTLQNSLTQLRNDYIAFLTTYGNDLAETRRLINSMQSSINTINGQIANLQNNLAAVNTSITAILATINTIEQSFENIKTAFTGIQSEWHDYKEDVDDEIEQLQQDWVTYKATIISEVTNLVTQTMGNYVLKTGDTMTGELTINNNSKGLNVNPVATAIEWKSTLLAVALRFTRTDSNGGRIDIVPGYFAANSQPFIKFLSANAPFNGADVLLQRVATPIANNDAANKEYVDTKAGDYVLKAGDTMTGPLVVNSYSGVTVDHQSASRNVKITPSVLRYINKNDNSYIGIAGNTINTNIPIISFETSNVLYGLVKPILRGVSNPINNEDAANKKYVDDSATVSNEFAKTLARGLAESVTYYISSTLGDDNNDGSAEHPFKTFAKLDSVLYRASAPGGQYVIMVGNGTYDEPLRLTDISAKTVIRWWQNPGGNTDMISDLTFTAGCYIYNCAEVVIEPNITINSTSANNKLYIQHSFVNVLNSIVITGTSFEMLDSRIRMNDCGLLAGVGGTAHNLVLSQMTIQHLATMTGTQATNYVNTVYLDEFSGLFAKDLYPVELDYITVNKDATSTSVLEVVGGS